MTWWMSWSRNSSARLLFGACLLVALLFGIPRSASAQESFEVRSQHAMDLFNGTKMEDACEAFKALNKENPGDKQSQMYLKISCDQVKKLQKSEEDAFNQGVQLFNQGQYEDARQKFVQSASVGGLKNHAYRDKALDYVKKINDAAGKQHAEDAANKNFDDGVRLFKARSYPEAREAFNKVTSANGPKAGEARDYLAKIQEAIEKQGHDKEIVKTFEDGVRLYKARDYANAKLDFDKVVSAAGPDAAEAQNYLRRIEKATEKAPSGGGEVAGGNPPPTHNKPAGGTGQSTAGDETLRAGLKAYYAGDLEGAQHNLKNYIDHNGQKKGLAYFFSGAVHSTLYFLSGEKDSGEKSQAVADFQAAKSSGQGFQPPPQKYVSPKILDLYSKVATP